MPGSRRAAGLAALCLLPGLLWLAMAPGGAAPAGRAPARTAREDHQDWAARLASAHGAARCALCHDDKTESLAAHGMADSLGSLAGLMPGAVRNTANGHSYRIAGGSGTAVLEAVLPDGGVRRQRLVGRIGAGRFARSFVGTELDAAGGDTGRLFYAPLEAVAGHGLALAPFERYAAEGAVGLPLTGDCLGCHSLTSVRDLPGAATAGGRAAPFPPHQLGADAFAHLEPLGCATCHGPAGAHPEILPGLADALAEGDIGVARIGALPAAAQRDICARCHLQGDVRIDLAGGAPHPDKPLAAVTPVVAGTGGGDDFRFVGQSERLALSACFQATPDMTCATCHDPHAGVAAQGLESLEGSCVACHAALPPDHMGSVAVAAVTGAPARTEAGCIDCHMRRSEPFDLPHVRSADHFVRRSIPPPEEDGSHRQFADRLGPHALVSDSRLDAALATEAGRRWRDGVMALAMARLGRFEESAALFERFPEPGTAAARRPTAPPELMPVETHPPFHVQRALLLMAAGRVAAAKAAFGDAILLDPLSAPALLGRARLRFDSGDIEGALRDTQAVIEAFPEAEQPWDLRLEMAERLGRADLALAALRASTARWPSNPEHWRKLSILLARQGDHAGAAAARKRVEALRPSLLQQPGR